MKTNQAMLNAKHHCDLEDIESDHSSDHIHSGLLTLLDDCIVGDLAPRGDGDAYWNYITSLNL